MEDDLTDSCDAGHNPLWGGLKTEKGHKTGLAHPLSGLPLGRWAEVCPGKVGTISLVLPKLPVIQQPTITPVLSGYL